MLLPRLSCGAPALLADLLALVAATVMLAIVALTLRPDAGRVLAGGAAFSLAVVFLAAAAGQPQLVPPTDPSEGGQIVVVIDGSDSVWRDGSAAAALEKLAASVAATAGTLAPEARAAWTGHVLRFGRAAEALSGKLPLEQLPTGIRAAAPNSPSDASNGVAGLAAALDLIRAGTGRGAIFMLTDGLFSNPIPDRLLDEVAQTGVAVHVLSAGSSRPGAGFVAANLGPEQRVGAPAVLRFTLSGAGRLSVQAASQITDQDIPSAATLIPGRAELTFSARGLQPAVLQFEAGGAVQERVLFTLVRGPVRVLVFGPATLAAALDPMRWTVDHADPRAPPPPGDYDIVLIDSLAPEAFAPGYPEVLTDAAAGGIGLLLVNGAQRGAVTDPQRFADWEETPLGPLLPVSGNPRYIIDAPPPRDVALLIDVSGSMSLRGRMETARAVAQLVLDSLLPQDTITIVRFGTRARRFGPERATSEVLARAREVIRATVALNEGTDVNVALDEADRVRGAYCAYFLISDADFYLPWRSPQCDAYAIGVAGIRYDPARVPLDRQRILGAGEIPTTMTFQFFEPEERAEFWLADTFVPRAGDDLTSTMAVPLAVDGLALAYPRIGARVLAYGPGTPAAPLAAIQTFADRPGLATGVFLSAVPDSWLQDQRGTAAIEALLSALVGWSDDVRHDIRATLDGEQLTLSVTALASDGGAVPATLSARLVDGAGQSRSVPLRQEGAPGRFVATTLLPRVDAAGRGLLVIEEPDRLPQRIPLLIPSRGMSATGLQGDEALDFGIDRDAIARLMQVTGGGPITGGAVDSATSVTISTAPQPRPVHAWLVVLALCFLAGSYWVSHPRGTG